MIDEKAATAMVKGLPELPPGVFQESIWSARLTKVAEWFAGTQAGHNAAQAQAELRAAEEKQ